MLSQYLTLLFALIIAASIQKAEKEKALNCGECFAFSLNGAPWSEECEKELIKILGNGAMLGEMFRALEILDNAPLEKHRHSKDTDVRICTDGIIIKNSGAAVCDKDFENSTLSKVSKVLGFNQVNITI